MSILRLNALVTLARHPEDTTWYGTATAYWSAIEVNLGIVCASTPALKPLVVKIIPRFATTRYGSNQSNSRNTKDSKDRRSFLELKGKHSQGSMSDDLESGNHLSPTIALPTLTHIRPAQHNIHYMRDFEQYSEHFGRSSEIGSQHDLVPNGLIAHSQARR